MTAAVVAAVVFAVVAAVVDESSSDAVLVFVTAVFVALATLVVAEFVAFNANPPDRAATAATLAISVTRRAPRAACFGRLDTRAPRARAAFSAAMRSAAVGGRSGGSWSSGRWFSGCRSSLMTRIVGAGPGIRLRAT